MRTLLSILFFLPFIGYSQCNNAAPVTYTIAQTAAAGEIYRPAQGPWKGGDTVKITGTSYSVIEFYSIKGDACRPIVIVPATKLTTQAFRITGDCQYLKILGGDSLYGITCANGVIGVTKANHISFDNMQAYGASIGIYCRFDVDTADASTFYPNYTVNKISFNHIYVHDVAGEGMYIGNTQPNGYIKKTRSGADTLIVGIRQDSISVTNCISARTGWDGIQLSNCRNGAIISGNDVSKFGLLNISGQKAGIILGGNTSGSIFGNNVYDGYGNGIQMFGYSTIKVHDNTVTNVGYSRELPDGEQSIYSADYITSPEVNPKQNLEIYNNQINQPQQRGAIWVYNAFNNLEAANVHDNKICITPTPGSNWQSSYLHLEGAITNFNNILQCSAPPVIRPGCNCIIAGKFLNAN